MSASLENMGVAFEGERMVADLRALGDRVAARPAESHPCVKCGKMIETTKTQPLHIQCYFDKAHEIGLLR